jgi:hypothetical protein
MPVFNQKEPSNARAISSGGCRSFHPGKRSCLPRRVRHPFPSLRTGGSWDSCRPAAILPLFVFVKVGGTPLCRDHPKPANTAHRGGPREAFHGACTVTQERIVPNLHSQEGSLPDLYRWYTAYAPSRGYPVPCAAKGAADPSWNGGAGETDHLWHEPCCTNHVAATGGKQIHSEEAWLRAEGNR